MKNIVFNIFLILIIFAGCNNSTENKDTDNSGFLPVQKEIPVIPDNPKEIKVIVFAGDGAPTSRNIELSLRLCNQYNLVDGYYFDVTRVFSTPSDKLNRETLDKYDVLLIPGGYPSRMYYSWEKEDIRDWLHSGGGYVGICAGEIIAVEGTVLESIFGSFEGLEIAPGITRETSNWVGERNIRMTETGAKVLGFSGDQRIMQWNGSAFTIKPGANSDIIIFADYYNNSIDREPFEHGSSKWKENFNNRPAIVGLNYGAGRVILAGPHPEDNSKSKAMQKAGMLGAMIKWAYGDDTPLYFTIGRKEILPEEDMSDKLRAMSAIASSNCTISGINIYIKEGSGRVIAGIYNTNIYNKPGELLAQSDTYNMVIKNPGWLYIPFNKEVQVMQDETLWLAWIFEDYPVTIKMDLNLWEGDIGSTIVKKSNISWKDLNTGELPGIFPPDGEEEGIIVSIYSTGIPSSR